MPRLFVIHAASEPQAVILRRGPSRWFHLIQWNTDRDSFVHGAWFKGRLYEDKCDLSPDGRLFIYFAHQGSRNGSEFTDSWTAISRSPWLHALAVWPQGTTYGGGGRFIDNSTINLRGCIDPPHRDYPLHGIRVEGNDAPTHASTNEIIDSDWCGRDQQNRIVFTRGGRLFRRQGNIDNLIADFTDLTPSPEPAPDWAMQSI